MKFIKGVVVGTMFAAGTAIMYKDIFEGTGKKMVKKARRLAKKMGVM